MFPPASVVLFATAIAFHVSRPAACAKAGCAPATVEELRQRLGPAYNPRYMSIDKPPPKPDEHTRIYVRHTEAVQNDAPHSEDDTSDSQRDLLTPSFCVDPDFKQDVVEDEIDVDALVRARRNDGSTNGETSSRVLSKSLWLRKEISRESIKDSDQASTPSSPQLSDPRSSRGRREQDTKKPWGCESRMDWQDLGEDRFPRYLRTVHCKGEQCWFTHFRCKGRAFTVKVLRRVAENAPCSGGTSASPENLPDDLRENWVFEERAVTFCCDCTKDD